jgi:hypothetical protein
LQNRVPKNGRKEGITADDQKVYGSIKKRYKKQYMAGRILSDKKFFSPEQEIRFVAAGRGPKPPDFIRDAKFEWSRRFFDEKGYLPSLDKFVWQDHRTAICLRRPAPDAKEVLVRKEKNARAAHYKNLIQCGNVWTCPACSAKITEHRCHEIVAATEKWYSEPGRTVVMLTLTIPHNIGQSLSYVLDHFARSRRLLRQQKPLKRKPTFLPWQTIVRQFLVAGTINGKEVTYGRNGWHVHSHELLFLDRDLSPADLADLQRLLTTAWIYACKRSGLAVPSVRDMKKRSVRVDRARTPADYITKYGSQDYHEHREILQGGWGASQEICKAHIKQGREKGKTPFDFLDLAGSGKRYYAEYGALFAEFARAFRGRRLITFSKGFRQLLGIDEALSDQEIVESEDSSAVTVGILTRDEFRLICRHRQRADICILAARGGWPAVEQRIKELGVADEIMRQRTAPAGAKKIPLRGGRPPGKERIYHANRNGQGG